MNYGGFTGDSVMNFEIGDPVPNFTMASDNFNDSLASTGGISSTNNDSDPSKPRPRPKRLPNGRFMSKSQVAAYESGVSLDEIIRQAEAEELEKKRKMAEDGAGAEVPKKKKKHYKKKKPAASITTAAESIKVEDVIVPSPVATSTPCDSKKQIPDKKTDSPCVQMAQQMPTSNLITLVNGQPVIQARLERIQTTDGNTITVAVIPGDLQNLLRSSGLVMPGSVQQMQPQQQQRPIASNSPIIIRMPPPPTTASSEQRFPPIQPKMNLQPIMLPSKPAEMTVKQQPVILPPNMPSERFVFRLSPDDEKIVAALNAEIARFHQLPIRQSTDGAALAQLEEKKRAILHKAASDQLRLMSISKNQPGVSIGNGPAHQHPQVIQVMGTNHHAAVSQPQIVLNVPFIANGGAQKRSVIGSTQQMHRTATTSTNLASQTIPQAISASDQTTVNHGKTLIERRRERLKERLAADSASVTQPDCDSPFRDHQDIINRLLPYHLHAEPNVHESLLSAADSEFRTHMGKCKDRAQSLYNRFFKALDKLTPMSSDMDNLLVNDLMLKGEREQLTEEQEFAAKSPDQYVQQYINRDSMNAESAKADAAEAAAAVASLESQDLNDHERNEIQSQDDLYATSTANQPTLQVNLPASSEDAFNYVKQEVDRPCSPMPTARFDLEPPTHAADLVPFDSTAADSGHSCPTASQPPVATASKSMEMPKKETSASSSQTSASDSYCEKQIEARISVKVVIRKRHVANLDDSQPSTSKGIHQKKTEREKADFMASVHADCDREGEETLRVPPLKIRLRCNSEPQLSPTKNRPGVHILGLDSSDSDEENASENPTKRLSIITGERNSFSCQLEQSPISEKDDDEEDKNSATTTSSLESGHQNDADLNEDIASGAQERDNGDVPAIPRLKLFRRPDFRFGVNLEPPRNNSQTSMDRWQRDDQDPQDASKDLMDFGDNEPSEDDVSD